MREARLLVQQHFTALCADADRLGVAPDLVGRLLLDEILALWRQSRTLDDIRDELDFAKSNLDPDQEFTFMRP